MSEQSNDGQAESIRHRLRKVMTSRGEDVSLGLQRYAVERFLYRLGRSQHRERFILKGATLFAIWGTAYRPTRDIDFTGYGSSDPESVIRAVREICETPDDVDALLFETESITAQAIRDNSEYGGLRIRLVAHLGNSKLPIQMDIGFANAIVPDPEEVEYRTLLGDPPPRLLAYPREAVVAEKLHAMVILAEANGRMKDFYDLYALAGAFEFERSTLLQAMKATFERRSTSFTDELPAALTAPFYAEGSRAEQWRAYVTKNNLADAPAYFVRVGDQVISFLQPLWSDLAADDIKPGLWTGGGPWR